MANIEKNVNLQEEINGIFDLGRQLMDSCPFPIGFGGFFQTDPNTIYEGTTWEQKKDVFILASGDTYPSGSTGGEAQHKLTVDEIPSHNHELLQITGHSEEEYVGGMLKATDGLYFAAAEHRNDNKYYWWSNTQYSGGSKPHNNMPPYFSMPFWIRTA